MSLNSFFWFAVFFLSRIKIAFIFVCSRSFVTCSDNRV